jgi:hypothetical protein
MKKKYFKPRYANDLDNLNPTLWAQESLAILEENMVIANLINRDYEDRIANYGETVNANRPAKFVPKRKGPNDDVSAQDAVSNKLPVTLDQHFYTTFIIKDSERSKAFQDLVQMYLQPAILNIATSVDRAVLGYVPRFLDNAYGQLGGLSVSTAKNYILGTRQMMVSGLLPAAKNAVITPDSEANLLELSEFTDANKVGDDGTALREASLGRKYGIDWFMGQNTPYVNRDTAYKAVGAIDNVGGYAIGDTDLTVDDFTAAIATGSYVTIAGSMYPYRVTGTVGGSTPTQINISPALRNDVTDDAVVTSYVAGAIDLSGSSYAAGYTLPIHIDGISDTFPPQVGQIVRIDDDVYTIISIENNVGTEADFLLNRPLTTAVDDGDIVAFGPGGSYNFAFSKDALGLVVRPMAIPPSNTGVQSAVVSFNDLAIRLTMGYDQYKQGLLVTADLLCGIAIFDTNQGYVMLG